MANHVACRNSDGNQGLTSNSYTVHKTFVEIVDSSDLVAFPRSLSEPDMRSKVETDMGNDLLTRTLCSPLAPAATPSQSVDVCNVWPKTDSSLEQSNENPLRRTATARRRYRRKQAAAYQKLSKAAEEKPSEAASKGAKFQGQSCALCSRNATGISSSTMVSSSGVHCEKCDWATCIANAILAQNWAGVKLQDGAFNSDTARPASASAPAPAHALGCSLGVYHPQAVNFQAGIYVSHQPCTDKTSHFQNMGPTFCQDAWAQGAHIGFNHLVQHTPAGQPVRLTAKYQREPDWFMTLPFGPFSSGRCRVDPR